LSTIKKFAGQTAVYGISTIFSRLLNFLLTPVFSKAYLPAAYSILTTLYAYASLISAVLAFGMETTFFRYLNKHADEKEKVYNNTFLIVIALSAAFVILCFVFSPDIATWLSKDSGRNDYIRYINYFAWILAADALAVIPFARIRAAGKPFRYALIKLVNIIVFVSSCLVFIYGIPYMVQHSWISASVFSWYRPGWIGYIFFANMLASVVTLALLLPEILQLRIRFDPSFAMKMFSYSFPVLIANLSFLVNENIDKMMMNRILPQNQQADLGVYGGCAKIAVFLSIFIQAFRLGAEPFFFSHAKTKNATHTYSQIMNYFVIAVCAIFVLIVTNIEIFKHFIRNPAYWVGLDVVPILLFGYVSLGIYMNLSIWYKLSDQTRYGLYISGTGAIVTIILNLVFIPRYSYMAAAWVSLTAYATMMILSYILGQKNYPIPYNLKKNLLYLVSSAGIAATSYVIFKHDLLIGNILLAAYLTGIAYIEKDELKKIWKMI
jgi:O-antigen/teichoic acid export membrane protein